MAEPSLLDVIDSYGIELIHTIREARSEQQIGKKGLSNKRWIVGGKLLLVLADSHFHAAAGDPPNLKICAKGIWNERMVIETALSMISTICHLKKVFHRT